MNTKSLLKWKTRKKINKAPKIAFIHGYHALESFLCCECGENDEKA